MKKKIFVSLALVLCLTVSLIGSAFATGFETYDYGYTVTYNSTDSKLDSGFNKEAASEKFSTLLPGDTIVITATLTSDSATGLRWYMRNAAEDFEANGGIYSYSVDFNGSVIYSSDTVGEGSKDGLADATTALENYFYLGESTAKGTFGTVTLTITLDPETHVNAYEKDISDLAMQFGVELSNSGKTTSVTTASPKTGDNANMALYAGLAAAAAVVLAAAAAYVIVGTVRKGGRKS